MKVNFSFPALRQAMINTRMTVPMLAKRMGYTPQNMYAKLGGRSRWNREEMVAVCQILGCTLEVFRAA